jgi:hypothetical protein
MSRGFLPLSFCLRLGFEGCAVEVLLGLGWFGGCLWAFSCLFFLSSTICPGTDRDGGFASSSSSAQDRHNLLLMYIVPVCPGTGQGGVDMPIGGFDPGLLCFFSLFQIFLSQLHLHYMTTLADVRNEEIMASR